MKILLKIFIIIILICNVYSAISQSDKGEIISILYQIEDIPYLPELSGDSLYWVLAIKGLVIVPILIDLIDDTTETAINVPNHGGVYTIGDIAFSILTDIIHQLPILEIIENKKDYPVEEGLIYFAFVRYNRENRNYLKIKLQYWFIENKDKLIWIKDKTKYKESSNWKYSSNFYPTKGYYKLK